MTNGKPILFSGSMVRAILDGRKTQTRRIVKPQPVVVSDIESRRKQKRGDLFIGPDIMPTSDNPGLVIGHAESVGSTHWMGQREFAEAHSPYGKPSDRLWVRETFSPQPHLNAKAFYQADDGLVGCKWKPSIFMPRALCRITLEVVKIRVERVQDISEEDAGAEGVSSNHDFDCAAGSQAHGPFHPDQTCKCGQYSDREVFQRLWESINKDRGYGWDVNPFVWVIQFRRIDQPATKP